MWNLLVEELQSSSKYGPLIHALDTRERMSIIRCYKRIKRNLQAKVLIKGLLLLIERSSE
jgi:hypothetical protein